jgi:hypothetical protein
MLAMPENAALGYMDWVRRSSGYAMLGMLLAWYLFGVIFQPIFSFALHVLYSGIPNS